MRIAKVWGSFARISGLCWFRFPEKSNLIRRQDIRTAAFSFGQFGRVCREILFEFRIFTSFRGTVDQGKTLAVIFADAASGII